jgi:hypothetical protein
MSLIWNLLTALSLAELGGGGTRVATAVGAGDGLHVASVG